MRETSSVLYSRRRGRSIRMADQGRVCDGNKKRGILWQPILARVPSSAATASSRRAVPLSRSPHQRVAAAFALEAAEFFSRDDNDLVAPVRRTHAAYRPDGKPDRPADDQIGLRYARLAAFLDQQPPFEHDAPTLSQYER
jgi:hypothetical protein